MNILEKLKNDFILLDGGMGTELQKLGLKPGEFPENWNLENPSAIIEIHKAYLSAGSDVISANTFGANSIKFPNNLQKIIFAGVECAKTAIKDFDDTKPRFIALDVGPLGKLLKPLGDLDFEDAVEIFAKTVRLGVSAGVDLILIETMNDSLETKAAVLAAKENSNLPIFVTNVYDTSGKLMTGADPATMVAMLEGLKVDALGLNCSLGPAQMKDIVKKLVSLSSTPVIVKPNAGLPRVKNSKTVFDVSSEDFAKEMSCIAKMGATVLGGCCGTDPKYIEALAKIICKEKFERISTKNITWISSYTHTVVFDNKPILIGERINPTGKKRFKEALIQKDIPYILNEGINQADAGVDGLDVNVGLPEIDEPELMAKVITELQSVTDLPLQIDTSDAKALENGLRLYNGKPMINSVNGKQENMNLVFPLAAKYGGLIVALTLDEEGIPTKAEQRVAIAEKIISKAQKYGIPKKDIIVDPLAMAISADTAAGSETLKAIKMLSEKGIKTILGVSNVSFGLPNRDFITSTFFALALENGLSAAIMNPYSFDMQKVYHSFLALKGFDKSLKGYIDFASQYTTGECKKIKSESNVSGADGLLGAIVKGLKEDARKSTISLLETNQPLAVINQHIIPALDSVGKGFEAKTVYLPQLLMSAEAATVAFEEVKAVIPKTETEQTEKIILATVKGDIHDIGKNIVKVLLENYGFSVLDLGRDVAPETILDSVIKEKVQLIGLSALMTTTVPAMAKTIKLLKENCPKVKTIVGGAVLTQNYADEIGADFYAKTAMDTVRFAEKLFKK